MKSKIIFLAAIIPLKAFSMPIHSHTFTAKAEVPSCYMTSEDAYRSATRRIEKQMTKKCHEFNARPKVTFRDIQHNTQSCGSAKMTTKYKCFSDGIKNILVEQFLYVGSFAENLEALDRKLKNKVKEVCPSIRVKVMSTNLEISSVVQTGEEVDLANSTFSQVHFNYPQARLRASIKCL